MFHGRYPGLALAGDPRSPGFARAAGSSRSPSDGLSAVASQGALVPRVRPSLSSGAIAPGSETGSVLVDGEGPSVDGGSIWDNCSGSSPVFGRVLFGVGRSPYSINTYPGCGRTRRSCCTSIFFFFFFFFFYEWEYRTGTMCPFSSLHPLKKGKEV